MDFADITQGTHRIPKIQYVKKEPVVACILGLAEMNHLMIFQRIKKAVEPVGIILITCEYASEKRYRHIPLSTPETVDCGRHVDNVARTHYFWEKP
ncbi:MAG: hypothetical protein MR681_05450 [Prevotella sp.]|nr:hypothetical protein [Prevotella sp.]